MTNNCSCPQQSAFDSTFVLVFCNIVRLLRLPFQIFFFKKQHGTKLKRHRSEPELCARDFF